MSHKPFSEIVGELPPERRERIDAGKRELLTEIIVHNLQELRQRRNISQVELAERLGKTQASVSAAESSPDNLLSTWKAAVEGMGGSLELVAVFEEERIAIPL